jgi:drug/metabolite transporter (DMT)-like permease
VIGPILIGVASFLWATDALVRLPSLGQLDATTIVFSEHLIITAVMLPWMLTLRRKSLFTIRRGLWSSLFLVGAGGSGFATVLFTESFRYVNPSVSILLQKIQPVLVVGVAYFALGERPSRRFYPWAALALAASLVLSLPRLEVHTGAPEVSTALKGSLFAFVAAVLWAIATVAGRKLVLELDAAVVSFWRFAWGLAALWLALLFEGRGAGALLSSPAPLLSGLFYMALIPGLAAMLLYYAGLAQTTASVATFVELIFPLSAVVLNTLVLGLPLTGVQLGAAAVLLVSVIGLTGISLRRNRA